MYYIRMSIRVCVPLSHPRNVHVLDIPLYDLENLATPDMQNLIHLYSKWHPRLMIILHLFQLKGVAEIFVICLV